MYVCVCKAVTDSAVQASIEAGATTREAVTHACRAGGDCGACHSMIETMIEDHLEDAPRPACCGAATSTSGESPARRGVLLRTKAA